MMSLLPFWVLNISVCVAVYGGPESSRISSPVQKMNEGLTVWNDMRVNN